MGNNYMYPRFNFATPLILFSVAMVLLSVGAFLNVAANYLRRAEAREEVARAIQCVNEKIGHIERGDILTTDGDPWGKVWMVVAKHDPASEDPTRTTIGLVLDHSNPLPAFRQLTYTSLCERVANYKLHKRNSPEYEDLYLQVRGLKPDN